jgi:hypothetical protein
MFAARTFAATPQMFAAMPTGTCTVLFATYRLISPC